MKRIDTMQLFILGLILFFGIHTVSIVNESWRDRMADKIGVWPWKGLYSLISLVGLVLIIYGYGLARTASTVLYSPAPWQTHLALILLLPVFPLLLATYFPGRIRRLVGHPMLIATILWAVAHLLANGRVIDHLLFGAFLVWAVADLISMARRDQRPLPGAPETDINDVIVVVAGLGLYIMFVVWLHALLIGVAVL